MKNYLLVALGLLARPVARAQAPAWQALTAIDHVDGSASTVKATTTDGSGNLYLMGSFTKTIQLGATTLVAAGNTDVFVAKWSPATGAFVWAQRVGGTANEEPGAVAVSGSSVYIAGASASPANQFGTGPTLVNANATGPFTNYDGFVAKLTDAGSSASFGWAVAVAGTGFESAGQLVVAGASLYVAGTFSGAAASIGGTTLVNTGGSSGPALYVAKLADAGTAATLTWAQQVQGAAISYSPLSTPMGLAVSGGYVYLAGNVWGPATFGSLSLPAAAGARTAFVARLTDAGPSGSFSWVQPVNSGAATDFADLSCLAVRGTAVYVAGLFRGPAVTIGSTTLAQASNSVAYASDVYVARYTDGPGAPAFEWALRAGGNGRDSASVLLPTATGVCLAGKFGSSTAPFGATTLTNVSSTPTNNYERAYDLFVARIAETSAGPAFAWAQQAGGAGEDAPLTLAQAGTTLYVAGVSNPGARFGSLALGGAAGQTGFLAALTDQALPARAATGLPGLTLYPNPAHATTTVRLPAGTGPATLLLLDALGRVVRTAQAPAGTDYALDLANLTAGVYALRVQVGEEAATRRLVVE